MGVSEWIALLAMVACATAILPGSLGILMLTNRLAAEAQGARLIYQHSRILLAASVIGIGVAWLLAARGGSVSTTLVVLTTGYGGIILFGFLMHTRLMFRPVRTPTFIPVSEALDKFDGSEEVVGVLDPEGTPYAFIARLARRPHIVHQPEGKAPFMMTHCILSHSSMAYENSGAFDRPEIMITAAIANNMVFYDARNRCSVTQLHNASRDGTLPLKMLPSLMMSLATWAELYPDSQVWLRPHTWRDAFYLTVLARADVIDPQSPVLVYPLMHASDKRLPLKELVLGVEVNGAERAYPLNAVSGDATLNDQLGGLPLLIVGAFDGDYVQVFDRRLDDGTVLTFTRSGPRELVDEETGSGWNIKGKGTSGALAGRRLQPVPHYNKVFWFAWADYHPATDVYPVSASPADREQAA